MLLALAPIGVQQAGSSIISAYNTSDTATATLSGTWTVTPYVTGIAARILLGDSDGEPCDCEKRDRKQCDEQARPESRRASNRPRLRSRSH